MDPNYPPRQPRYTGDHLRNTPPKRLTPLTVPLSLTPRDHQGLRRTAHQRRQNPTRDPPLPQTIHRPQHLPLIDHSHHLTKTIEGSSRQGRLIAAIELKSQVGPSFGNNFNNRTEEAIGTAHDLWTAFREGALGEQSRPFLGWLMMVEDAPESRRPGQHDASKHFPTFPEFKNASYLQRYEILCRRLVQENFYTEACLVTSTRQDGPLGEYGDMSEGTSLRRFVAAFSGHIAAEAAQAAQ